MTPRELIEELRDLDDYVLDEYEVVDINGDPFNWLTINKNDKEVVIE